MRGGSRPGLVKTLATQIGEDTTGNISTWTDDSPIAGYTSVVADASIFEERHVGRKIRIDSNLREYTIVRFDSGTTVIVTNADSNAESGTFTIENSPVLMITNFRTLTDPTSTTFVDPFDVNPLPDPPWSALSGTNEAAPDTSTSSGVAQPVAVAGVADGTVDGAVYLDVGQVESSGYKVSGKINGFKGTGAASPRRSLFAKMNGTDFASAGEIVEARCVGGSPPTTTLHVNGAQIASTTSAPGADAGWFELEITASNDAKVYINGVVVITESLESYTFTGDRRVGFCVSQPSGSINGNHFFSDFKFSYFADSSEPSVDGLIGGGSGNLFYEVADGTMTEADYSDTYDLELISSDQIMAVDRVGTVYINESEELWYSEKGEIAIGSPTVSFTDTTNVARWDLLGIRVDSHMLEIIEVQTGGADSTEQGNAVGTYIIEAFNGATDITIVGGVTVTGTAMSNIRYRIVPQPKKIDLRNSGNTPRLLETWSADNNDTIPPNCGIVTSWNDRIVMAGDPRNAQVWYMSKIADPNDWDYTALTVGRATAGNAANTETGQLGKAITAIIPITNDRLIIAAATEMSMIVGDPTLSGFLRSFSDSIGVIGKLAWARAPDGNIVFLSKQGLYVAGPEARPEPFSNRIVPQALQNVDTDLFFVCMAYDVEEEGFHLYVTPKETGSASHWFIDYRTRAMWPVTLDSAHDPFTCAYKIPENKVVLGCRDGYLRNYTSGANDDDSTAFNSHVFIGPIPLGARAAGRGWLNAVQAIMDESSNDVTWSVFVGDTPQLALQNARSATGTWTGGLNYVDRLSAGGGWAYIKIENSGANAWAFEAAKIARVTGGEVLKL
jgi:hypothetical protein